MSLCLVLQIKIYLTFVLKEYPINLGKNLIKLLTIQSHLYHKIL
jgi:hypothetical protein